MTLLINFQNIYLGLTVKYETQSPFFKKKRERTSIIALGINWYQVTLTKNFKLVDIKGKISNTKIKVTS